MPENRTIALCVALSFLAHLTALFIFSLIPWTARKGDSVMVVDLADLPRAQDFLPPRAGMMEGAPPSPPVQKPPVRPEKSSRKPAPPPPARRMEGRVPDLPVDPSLPAEESFPQARLKDVPAALQEPPALKEREKEGPQKMARAGEKTEQGGPGKPLKELNPSLGKMVIALGKSGGAGSGTGAGNAVGTKGKTGEKGGIVEEGGGGARLTALNAPEIQYISYFAGIKRKIELVWGYPSGANGAEGDVVVDFVIGRNGRLENATLVRGSGHKALDDEAISAIRKASPFTPIPKEYKIANLQIRAHFIYTVTQTRILR